MLADGERHALEVELTRKSRHRLGAIITTLASEYDQVVYFCDPRVASRLAAAVAKEHAARVSIRDLGAIEAHTRDA